MGSCVMARVCVQVRPITRVVVEPRENDRQEEAWAVCLAAIVDQHCVTCVSMASVCPQFSVLCRTMRCINHDHSTKHFRTSDLVKIVR